MSKRVLNTFYIQNEPSGICEYCGKVDELRPYGRNGARICFNCGMRDRKTTDEMFVKAIEGATTAIVLEDGALN